MSVFDGLDSVFIGVFGDDATFLPSGGAGRPIRVIFEESGEMLTTDGEVQIVSRIPYGDFRIADAALAREDDRLQIRGGLYRLVGAGLPDGRGMVRWMMERLS